MIVESPRFALLVWQLIPENANYYLIPEELEIKFRDKLMLAQGKFINIDKMNDGLEFLNAALASDSDETDKYKKGCYGNNACHTGVLTQFKKEMTTNMPLIANIYAVYESGFYV